MAQGSGWLFSGPLEPNADRPMTEQTTPTTAQPKQRKPKQAKPTPATLNLDKSDGRKWVLVKRSWTRSEQVRVGGDPVRFIPVGEWVQLNELEIDQCRYHVGRDQMLVTDNGPEKIEVEKHG
jgi:hypothetical protein